MCVSTTRGSRSRARSSSLEPDLVLVAIGQSNLGQLFASLCEIRMEGGRIVTDTSGRTGRDLLVRRRRLFQRRQGSRQRRGRGGKRRPKRFTRTSRARPGGQTREGNERCAWLIWSVDLRGHSCPQPLLARVWPPHQFRAPGRAACLRAWMGRRGWQTVPHRTDQNRLECFVRRPSAACSRRGSTTSNSSRIDRWTSI